MTARLRITDAASIPNRMEDTPEGFLICRDVPLARTGEQIYYANELPGIPAKGGQIIAIRDEDEVFSPKSIESFRGKVFTDDHPDEDVTTKNFRPLIQGVIMNPRRGEGALADKLLGDLIVYDPRTIAKIKAGKREISNGYDADYEIIEPGRARQINIRGNHVSLVDEGRCGPACAIRDRKITMPKKLSWKDRLFAALRSTDEDERQELLKSVEAEMPDDGDGHVHEGDGHHITLNLAGFPERAPEKDTTRAESTVDEEGETTTTENTEMDEDKVNELIGKAMEPVTSALTAITEKLDAISTKYAETEEKVDDITEALDDMSDPEDMATQDAIARIAILAPGMTRPHIDAKPGSKPHRDAMANSKREALKAALTTDAGRAAVGAVLGHVQPHRIAAMSPAEVNLAVRAASQMVLDHNAARTAETLTSATSGYVRDEKGAPVRVMTPADLQAKANAYYKRSA